MTYVRYYGSKKQKMKRKQILCILTLKRIMGSADLFVTCAYLNNQDPEHFLLVIFNFKKKIIIWFVVQWSIGCLISWSFDLWFIYQLDAWSVDHLICGLVIMLLDKLIIWFVVQWSIGCMICWSFDLWLSDGLIFVIVPSRKKDKISHCIAVTDSLCAQEYYKCQF